MRKAQPAAKRNRRRARKQKAHARPRRESAGPPSRLKAARRFGTSVIGEQASDDALAVVGLEPVDLAGRARQMFPDGQQAGRSRDGCRSNGWAGFPPSSLSHAAVNSSSVATLPMACCEPCLGNGVARKRPDQAHAFFDAAVLERQARGGRGKRGAAGLRIDEERRAGGFRKRQNRVEVERLVLVLAPDGEQRGLGAGALMGVQQGAVRDRRGFRRSAFRGPRRRCPMQSRLRRAWRAIPRTARRTGSAARSARPARGSGRC